MDTRVEHEVTQLVSKINFATGITNSFDHNHTVDMFERLLAGCIGFDPEHIRQWLMIDLLAQDANAVKKMGEKFLAGKNA